MTVRCFEAEDLRGVKKRRKATNGLLAVLANTTGGTNTTATSTTSTSSLAATNATAHSCPNGVNWTSSNG